MKYTAKKLLTQEQELVVKSMIVSAMSSHAQNDKELKAAIEWAEEIVYNCQLTLMTYQSFVDGSFPSHTNQVIVPKVTEKVLKQGKKLEKAVLKKGWTKAKAMKFTVKAKKNAGK